MSTLAYGHASTKGAKSINFVSLSPCSDTATRSHRQMNVVESLPAASGMAPGRIRGVAAHKNQYVGDRYGLAKRLK